MKKFDVIVDIAMLVCVLTTSFMLILLCLFWMHGHLVCGEQNKNILAVEIVLMVYATIGGAVSVAKKLSEMIESESKS